MFEGLKNNLEHEKRIIMDMRSIQVGMMSDPSNRNFYISSLRALAEQLIFLNNTVPELLKEGSPLSKFAIEEKPVVEKPKSVVKEKSVSVVKRLKPSIKEKVVLSDKKLEPVIKENTVLIAQKPSATINMSYVSPSTKEKRFITINKKDRQEFLKKLRLSETALSRVKEIKDKSAGFVLHEPSFYVKISNRFFRKWSDRMAPHFGDLSRDLKKANMNFLLSSYISVMIMSSLIAFFSGVLVFGYLIYSDISYWMYFSLPFGLFGLVVLAFYLYPTSEASSIDKNISYELPFATIHMAAISSSNIEPTRIFKIISLSGEYPNIANEVRKVLVQINVYGYDLVTSLKNVATRTSNKKLGELFSGLATNISSGGSLDDYLQKKSENFLIDYRLERQKYSDLAGTFMDIYISILIAAPLILMMMFIVMNSVGLGMGGLSIMFLLMISVIAIVIVNILFLVVLNIKQPKV